jgi:hypothetical protein
MFVKFQVETRIAARARMPLGMHISPITRKFWPGSLPG